MQCYEKMRVISKHKKMTYMAKYEQTRFKYEQMLVTAKQKQITDMANFEQMKVIGK